MSMIRYLMDAFPFRWKTHIVDALAPRRPGIAPVLRSMDRSISTVFDIGANNGDVSRLMLHYFPRATVYSFEPCSDTYRTMVKNVGKAGYRDRSRPFRLGFFDRQTEGTLNLTSFHGANSMVEISKEYAAANPHIRTVRTETIPLMRLDDFTAQHSMEHIDLVKIDVEGVELQILRGGRETFSSKVDTVILELSFVRHPRESGEFIELLRVMHDYGFAPAQIFDVAQINNEREWKLAQFDCVFRRYRPSGRDAGGSGA